MTTRVVIVGGGIVGLATAYQLQRALPGVAVTVLEKEADVGQHQTGHNSGVLHSGLYYKPGSEKARLAVAGIREMSAFCAKHGVPHEICGKLVVAVNDAERPRLQALLERGTANGLRGLQMLAAEEMREREPHVGGVAAISVPEEGIVDYPAVCAALVREIRIQGGAVVTHARVEGVVRDGDAWHVESTAGTHAATFVVTCGGLHADRLAALTGARSDVRIVPFRGEYFALRPERAHLVRHLIYPVPDPAFPFLGVHFTRMIGGGIEAGPNAVLAWAREGYTKRILNVTDLADAVTFPGLWRFIARYPGATWSELRRSFSRQLFAQSLQRLVPEVEERDLLPGGAGVRAQAMRSDGTLVEDFAYVEQDGVLHVVNAPSPAATASLAIGGEIAQRVVAQLPLVQRRR